MGFFLNTLLDGLPVDHETTQAILDGDWRSSGIERLNPDVPSSLLHVGLAGQAPVITIRLDRAIVFDMPLLPRQSGGLAKSHDANE